MGGRLFCGFLSQLANERTNGWMDKYFSFFFPRGGGEVVEVEKYLRWVASKGASERFAPTYLPTCFVNTNANEQMGEGCADRWIEVSCLVYCLLSTQLPF